MKMLKRVVVAAVLGALTFPAHADNVWDGSAADGLWTNGANWSLNVAPANGQGNTIFNDISVTNQITLGPGDTGQCDGDMFGPEWGMHWTIDGGSFTQNSPGFVWAPIGASGDHSIVTVKNNAYLEVQELALGNNWWFNDAPYVDMSISGTGTVVKARGWMWCAGHVDLHEGTLDIGGSINLDTTGKGYLKINIEAGQWIIRNNPSGTDADLYNKIYTAIAADQITAYGGVGELSITNVDYGYGITAIPPDFLITGSPTDSATNTTRTLQAQVVEFNSTFNQAVLYLDSNPVATNSVRAGVTNTISYVASDLLAGTHEGKVVVDGTNPVVTVTNIWSFEVMPFASVVGSPSTWTTNANVTLQAVVVNGASSLDTNSTTLYLDGSPVAAGFDISSSPTTTISYASTLSHGVHTGKVVAVGSPAGVVTNEWTFQVVLEETKPLSIVHHWDFEENGGTTVHDIEGGADGTIIGSNYNWVVEGLDLWGNGTSGTWDPTNSGAYVDLPNDLLGSLSNSVSFEATYLLNNDHTSWLRVWDLGNNAGGEGVATAGAEGVFLTSRGSAAGGPRVSYSTNNPAVGLFALDSPIAASTSTVTHVVWVYNGDTGMNKMYLDGVLVAAEVAPPVPLSVIAGKDVNNWLGRSQWAGDYMFDGTLYDFRIYDGIMTASEVAAHYNSAINIGGPGFAPNISFINVAGSNVTLSWTADSKGIYSILRKTDLTAASWNVVVSNLPPGNLTTNVTASGAAQEFYKVMGE